MSGTSRRIKRIVSLANVAAMFIRLLSLCDIMQALAIGSQSARYYDGRQKYPCKWGGSSLTVTTPEDDVAVIRGGSGRAYR